MEEHFILRVPQSVAERLERVLNEDPDSAGDKNLDLTFEATQSGTFTIGQDKFPATLLDMPCSLESYKTYDNSVLIKAADIGQMIVVQEEGEPPLEGPESKHGLTLAMRDARCRRFRREPNLNPKLVHQVENDLQSIMAGGTARNVDVEVVEQETDDDDDDDPEAEEPAPTAFKTSQAAEKPKASAAPKSPDEAMGDGYDEFDDHMNDDAED